MIRSVHLSKTLLYLLISLILILSLVLCGCQLNSTNRSSAEQVALDYFELIAHQNAEPLIALGMPVETADTILTHMNDSLCKQVKTQLSMDGKIDIDDESVNQIVSSYIASLKKLKATATATKTSEGYTVTLSTQYIDSPKIDEAAINKALAEIDMSTYSDQKEYLNELTSSYINFLSKGYDKATPSKESIDMDFSFTLQEGLYLPEDYDHFTTSLFLLISHQE